MKYHDLPSPFLIWCFFLFCYAGRGEEKHPQCGGDLLLRSVKHMWMLLCVRPYEYRQLKMNRTGIPALGKWPDQMTFY